MTKTYKPSEINILNRQVVTTDKINLNLDEAMEYIKTLLSCPTVFKVMVAPFPEGKYSVYKIRVDEELSIEQFNEAWDETKYKERLHNSLHEQLKMLVDMNELVKD